MGENLAVGGPQGRDLATCMLQGAYRQESVKGVIKAEEVLCLNRESCGLGMR